MNDENPAFLLRLSDALRAETNADTVANRALQMLFEHLKLDRCYVGVYRLADDRGDFTHQVGNDRVPRLPDGVRLSDFPAALRTAFERTLTIDDIDTAEGLSDTDRRNLKAIGLRALVAATLRKGANNPHWSIVAISASPRPWSGAEVALLEDAAERTWSAIERVRAEETLRESERRYRTLFETMGQGYCDFRILRDAAGRAVDLQYLELNPAFERIFGIPVAEVKGRTATEVFPQAERWWYETFDRIAKRGEPERIERPIQAFSRWFEVQVYPRGGDRLTVLYEEVTERKRAEAELRESEERQAFLLKLSDALRPLADPVEVQTIAMRTLAARLGLDRAAYWEVQEDGDRVRKMASYDADLPPVVNETRISHFGTDQVASYLAGRPYAVSDIETDARLAATRAAFRAIHVRAFAGVPLVKNGRLVVVLGVDKTAPHPWADSEVRLLQEAAERTWAAAERARAEAALRESEERLRLIVESARDYAIFTIDADLRVDRWLPGAQSVFGWTKEEIEGRPYDILFTPEDCERGVPQQEAETASREGKAPDVRWHMHKDGRRVFIEGQSVPLTKGGEHSGFLKIGQDVTERRRAEQALRESEAHLAAELNRTNLLRDLAARLVTEESLPTIYAEILSAAIAITEGDAGTVQSYDPATNSLVLLATEGIASEMADYFQRVGADTSTACGRALRTGLRSFVGFDEDLSDEACRMQVEAGFTSGLAIPLLARDGSPIGMLNTHWRRSGHRPSEDQLRFLDLLARQAADLIEQRRAEAALRESEERLRLASTAARMGIWTWDFAADVQTRDAQLNAMLGLPPVETSQTIEEFFDHIHSDVREFVRGEFGNAASTRNSLNIEFRVVHPDGAVRWLRDQGDVLRAADGGPLLMTGACIDVTDRKEIEAALRDRERQLQELNVSLDERVREQTAELRERETRLRGLALQLTEAEQKERKRIAEVLHDYLQQQLAAAKMRVELLRISSPEERGDAELNELADMLNEGIQTARSLSVELAPPVLHERGLGFGLEWLAKRFLQQHHLTVDVDFVGNVDPGSEQARELLFHLTRELLLNVVKHAETTEAWIELDRTDSHLTIAVIDEGKGFDADKSLRERESFGLFHVRERIEQVGGRLHVESELGKGSRVTIVYPLNVLDSPAKVAAHAAGRHKTPAPSGQRLRVLLADDHAIVRKGIAGLVGAGGDLEIVGEAGNGRAAVELAKTLRPDVVMMDVNMPKMDGIEATREIMRLLPATRVIGLSIHESEDLAEAMLGAGAEAYVAKNAPAQDILDAIRGIAR